MAPRQWRRLHLAGRRHVGDSQLAEDFPQARMLGNGVVEGECLEPACRRSKSRAEIGMVVKRAHEYRAKARRGGKARGGVANYRPSEAPTLKKIDGLAPNTTPSRDLAHAPHRHSIVKRQIRRGRQSCRETLERC